MGLDPASLESRAGCKIRLGLRQTTICLRTAGEATMRRVLAAISNHMDTGDITTLANPDIVEQIRQLVQGREIMPLAEGPEDIKRFGEER